jgi:polar amino acid transport system substrate-binding protein
MSGWRQVGIVLVLLGAVWAQGRAQGQGDFPELLEAGKLTFGTAPTFRPFAYEEGGVLRGFDVELGALLARRLGLKSAYRKMDFDELLPALEEGAVDAVISAVYLTEEREDSFDFVPYMQTGSQIVVAVGNPRAIAGPDDLCGLRVAVVFETVEEGLANWIAGKCAETPSETPSETLSGVTVYETSRDAALAMRRDNADAIVAATLGALTLVERWPWLFEFAGATIGERRLIGIAVRIADEDLRAALAAAAAGLAADGTYDSLLKEFGLPPGVSPF